MHAYTHLSSTLTLSLFHSLLFSFLLFSLLSLSLSLYIYIYIYIYCGMEGFQVNDKSLEKTTLFKSKLVKEATASDIY